MSRALVQAAEALRLDPPDTSAESECIAMDVEDVKKRLRGMRSFRSDAMYNCAQDAYDALLACRRAHDLVGFRAQRQAIFDAHADSLIDSASDHGWRSISAAAHIVKRQFQRDESRSFPHRSAASPAPSPCGVAAERPFPPPAPVRPLDAGSPPAAGLSSDTRVAA